MTKLINLIGKKFGKLTAISYVGNCTWLCLCSCGNTTKAISTQLRSGHRKSCGCLRLRIQHGDTGTKFYRSWASMKCRVKSTNPTWKPYYLDKGIRVYARWKDYKNFKTDMYKAYKQHVEKYGEENTTLDRKDNNGDYHFDNCRWTTWTEQNRNRG